MSESVGKILQTYGDASVQQTAKFILLVDQWFDCMNVRHTGEAGRKRKDNLKPYESEHDPRLKVIREFWIYSHRQSLIAYLISVFHKLHLQEVRTIELCYPAVLYNSHNMFANDGSF